MLAKVYDLNQWKSAHNPAVVTWQYNLSFVLAWNELLIRMIYGKR